MTTTASLRQTVLTQLGALCERRGLAGLGDRFDTLAALVSGDLAEFSAALTERPPARSLVERSAAHLLALGGKRLRPMCVALAARVGRGFDADVRELAVAAELGADVTVDYTTAGWAAGLEGVDVGFDGVGGALGADLLAAMAPGGRVLVYGGAGGPFAPMGPGGPMGPGPIGRRCRLWYRRVAVCVPAAGRRVRPRD